MESLEDIILQYLDQHGPIEHSLQWSQSKKISHEALSNTLRRLEGFEMVKTGDISQQLNVLTEEGEEILKMGSSEVRVVKAIPREGIAKAELESRLGEAFKIGFSYAMKNHWVNFDKATGLVHRVAESVDDVTQKQLQQVHDSPNTVDPKILAELKKRKLIINTTVKIYTVAKGAKFNPKFAKLATDLTPEMLANGSWKNESFKPYNFEALGVPPSGGHLHPLMKVRSEFREIFLQMGFEEMPTNNFVESSFWNFDTLFQPQQHPARDAHDTFFLSDPEKGLYFPEDYLNKVKKMHENGGFNSIGWRYDWSIEETKKNILRTHTTAVSSRMLYKLAQEGFQPKKYFSIDRVFRNEALDATHLAEFHQIEGLVADYNITLANLIGIITEFFKRLGIEKLRFKPAYNPYTEPSMEVFSYHEGLKRWVEIGNSGVFRPEMLRPMGLPPNVGVIAWGLSLERPTMIKYKISNIRELVGHKINIEFVKNNPIARLDQ